MSNSTELLAALKPVANALTEVGANFFVGGSVASSYHGASRSTMDVDIVANIQKGDVDAFLRLLGEEYYASESAILDAINRKSCFNLIHYATSFKVDVFVFKGRPFDHQSMKRAIKGQLEFDSDFVAPIASPEDTIVSKLEWYRLGDETSERQWEDITRVLKVLGEKVDLRYLHSAAQELGVKDLLDRLLDKNDHS